MKETKRIYVQMPKKVVASVGILPIVIGVALSALCSFLAPVKNVRVINGDNIKYINDSVRNINWGGCGYFALKLYERLDKDAYSIVSLDDLTHVVILENRTGLFIDSDGFHDSLSIHLRYGGKVKFGCLTEDSLRKLVNSASVWNKIFKRKDTTLISSYINRL